MSLVDEFTCGKCLGDPCGGQGPVVLSCGHLFCSECCVISTEETTSGFFECGMCKTYSRSLPSISLPLKEFLDDLRMNNVVNEDLLQCSICLDILWKPTVLECGHWMCFWCLEGTFSRSNSCPLCRHTMDVRPKLYLDFHNFILRHCPSSQERAEDPALIEMDKSITTCVEEEERTQQGLLASLIPTLIYNTQNTIAQYDWKMLGCDGCGVFPIIGPEVYRCMNCMEAIGYDLCTKCYEHEKANVGELAGQGRYDQQHDPGTHEFVKITPQMLRAELSTDGSIPSDCRFQ